MTDKAAAGRSRHSDHTHSKVKSNFTDHEKWRRCKEATKGQTCAYPVWKGQLKRRLNDDGVLLKADYHTLLAMWASGASPTEASERCRAEGLVE